MSATNRAFALLQVHNSMISERLEQPFGGREIKHTGDGFMLCFDSASRGYRLRHRDSAGVLPPTTRKSLLRSYKYGSVFPQASPWKKEGDLFGSAVNLAARICDQAGSDRILAAEIVRQNCPDERHHFIDQESVKLKGFSERIPLFEIAWRD